MPSLKDKQAEEMKLWRRWQSGDTDAIGPLMRSYEPVVQQQVNKLKNAPLPPIFIETEVKKQLLGAFETYDPNRGTQLNTWVHSRLPKVLRNTIYSYSNLGYIPERCSPTPTPPSSPLGIPVSRSSTRAPSQSMMSVCW